MAADTRDDPITLVIEVRHLTKHFGRFTAVDDLSFTVKAGEAVALWGANGAGKTTAVRCLLNLFPFEGEIVINGMDVRRQSKEVRRQIGFVPQELSFHDDMTVAETLIFYARLKKVPDGFDFEPLLEQVHLTPHVKKRIGELSGGLKQRLALAVALLSDPPILVLDEPTASLDIRSREEFLFLLRSLKKSGKTMIFSSHHLEEVTALADRVLLLEGGRLVVDSPPDQLERRLGWETTLHLYLPEEGIEPALQTLEGLGIPVSRNGRGIRVHAAPGNKGKVLRVLQESGINVEDFSVE
ncbi:MAG: ABC transporter ATP-binding protein [Candidatus Promineofilum sp.]|uniref:ABC transporter ATP-binding protein n=1 Tax=Promineifilum sp. TaxID=2664178 RepID=UPI002411E790|nr:ABC transporter ATP-binding protein [Promineifilum sp.]